MICAHLLTHIVVYPLKFSIIDLCRNWYIYNTEIITDCVVSKPINFPIQDMSSILIFINQLQYAKKSYEEDLLPLNSLIFFYI